jgi:hypothetical protein
MVLSNFGGLPFVKQWHPGGGGGSVLVHMLHIQGESVPRLGASVCGNWIWFGCLSV